MNKKQENKKEKRINELVIKLQSIGRKYISRVDFLLQKSSALIIITKVRQFIAKCRVDTIRKTKRVITIQTGIRRFILRSLYLRKKKSINRIIHAIRLFIIVKRNKKNVLVVCKKYQNNVNILRGGILCKTTLEFP